MRSDSRAPCCQSEKRCRPVSVRRTDRVAGSSDGAFLRPWRRRTWYGGKVARRVVALDAHARGAPALRPRHGRQQGPAFDQHCGARRASSATRGSLGFNCKLLIETGRRGRFAGSARVMHAPRRHVCAPTCSSRRTARGSAPVSRRCFSATAARSTSTLASNCARARTIPAIGVGAREPGHHLGARARKHHDGAGKNFGRRLASERTAESDQGARSRSRNRRRRRRARDRSELGRTGIDHGRESLRLEHLRDPVVRDGQSGEARQCDPAHARAHCQIRFVVGVDPEQFLPSLRRHLDRHGFENVTIARSEKGYFSATRLDADHPWVRWVVASMKATTNKDVADPAQHRRLAAQ